MRNIQNIAKNKITIQELQDFLKIEDYQQFAREIKSLEASGQIVPVKSSRGNGKKPVLYNRYRVIRPGNVKEKHREEWKYFVPELIMDYYKNNPQNYADDRDQVLKLNQYLLQKREKLRQEVSINERSFEIFGREKFLLKEGGTQLLNRLGMSLLDLNCYPTSQPLSYYSHSKQSGQNILFVENKDTFYTMRKYMLEQGTVMLGTEFGTLIYGGGKSVYRSLEEFEQTVEPYMKSSKNHFYYFGDLDYEGILIYEKVASILCSSFQVKPMLSAYLKMLEKAVDLELPISKEAQNRNTGDKFFRYFTDAQVKTMQEILSSGRYIPQEILQMSDF